MGFLVYLRRLGFAIDPLSHKQTAGQKLISVSEE